VLLKRGHGRRRHQATAMMGASRAAGSPLAIFATCHRLARRDRAHGPGKTQ
jgi:hypothetical protein